MTGSRDVKLSWEQKYVAQAVDMLIGQRAQVLIGNGVSGGIVFVDSNALDGDRSAVLQSDLEHRHDAHGQRFRT